MARKVKNTIYCTLHVTFTSIVILLVSVCMQVVLAAAPGPKILVDSTNPGPSHPVNLYSRNRHDSPVHHININGSPSFNHGNTNINSNSDSSSDTSEQSTRSGSGSDVARGPNGSGSGSSFSSSTSTSASSRTSRSSSSASSQQFQSASSSPGMGSGQQGPSMHLGNSSLADDVSSYSGTDTGLGSGFASQGQLCTEKSGCGRPIGFDMKKLSLQMIRHDILRKLRMDENRLPNITGKDFPIPPDYINEFIDMQSDSPRDDYDDEHATTEKIIAFSRIQQLKITPKETRGVYYFTFSDKLSNMKVEKAMLYIHVTTAKPYPHHVSEKKIYNFTIRLMELVPQKKGESPLSINYGYFKPVFRPAGDGHGHSRHNKSKWVQIDVRDALTKWLAGAAPSASKRIGLVIEAIDPNGQDVSQDVTIVSTSEMDVNSNPFIEVHVSDKGKSRPPRNIGMTCDENSQETRCCRYPLTVDFEDFGWDWIIAPKKYDANYCSGECPYAFLQKYPHNHIVQQAIPTGVGGPCCAARKMSSISMLYFDSDSNIVYSVLPGMVVDKCGCS